MNMHYALGIAGQLEYTALLVSAQPQFATIAISGIDPASFEGHKWLLPTNELSTRAPNIGTGTGRIPGLLAAPFPGLRAQPTSRG